MRHAAGFSMRRDFSMRQDFPCGAGVVSLPAVPFSYGKMHIYICAKIERGACFSSVSLAIRGVAEQQARRYVGRLLYKQCKTQ